MNIFTHCQTEDIVLVKWSMKSLPIILSIELRMIFKFGACNFWGNS